MIVASTIEDFRAALVPARSDGKRIGLVPTMGALHEGHLSLIRCAREQTDVVAATIFVNPTQFGAGEDFETYPRPRERDLELCRDCGVEAVFTPPREVMYPEPLRTTVEVPSLARLWEGAVRPSHFAGVTTVVLKLLHIAEADVAFFGQKDYQQQVLIRRMCRDLNVRTRIHTCETVREPDGLALSSRNAYLSPPERAAALCLSRALQAAVDGSAAGDRAPGEISESMQRIVAEEPLAQLDYATVADAHTLEAATMRSNAMVALIAARIGTTRLIDNVLVPPFDLESLNQSG